MVTLVVPPRNEGDQQLCTLRSKPICQDCKWPEASKVSQLCGCRTGASEPRDEYNHALAEARELQRAGVPLTDPRYY